MGRGRRAACSLPGIRILVLAYGPEQHTLAQVHEAHETPVMAMITSVAEKISGVRNEL